MHMIKKLRLNAAVIFFFAAAAAAPGGAYSAGAPALDSLLETVGLCQPAALAPAPVGPSAAVARVTPAPKPGKDLLPVIQDQIRVKAILKLLADIYNGVHLPYSQDGATFTNREGRLPAQPHGFYKEYTLLTGSAPHTVVIGGVTYQVAPDLSARGSERLIVGGGEKIYYTPDHYGTFIQLTMVY